MQIVLNVVFVFKYIYLFHEREVGGGSRGITVTVARWLKILQNISKSVKKNILWPSDFGSSTAQILAKIGRKAAGKHLLTVL